MGIGDWVFMLVKNRLFNVFTGGLLCGALFTIDALAEDTNNRFEVTSVKRNTLPPRSIVSEFGCEGNRFVSRGFPVDMALRYAFTVDFSQLEGIPSWGAIGAEIYDIEGRASRNINDEECRGMVEQLLVDRFKLIARRELREVAVLALVVDKNGPKLRKVEPPDDDKEN